MMASLPSVVLGFVAALVVAPLCRDRLFRRCLAGVVVVPLTYLVGGASVAAFAGAVRICCSRAGDSPSSARLCRSAC